MWVARQTGGFGFSRTCAVKVIRPELSESRSFRSMFLDEARLASKIHHPNVVEVYDLGEEGPIVYLAMELVKGSSLARLLQPRVGIDHVGLVPAMIARIIADMASGLHAAHELRNDDGALLQLVHRDISPQNILVSLDGVAKVADFGVAKALGRLAEETDAGQIKGKFSYLSPEQAARRAIDRRSDVFATGIVLWEALVGRRLFRGEDAIDTISRVQSVKIPDPRQYVPGLAPELAAVTLKALEREPRRRYQTAAELSEALDEAARAAGPTVSTRQLGVAIGAILAAPLADPDIPIAMAEGSNASAAPTASAPRAILPRRRALAREFVIAGIGGLLAVCVGGAATYRIYGHPAAPTAAGAGALVSVAPAPPEAALAPSSGIAAPVSEAPAPTPRPGVSSRWSTTHRRAPGPPPIPKPSSTPSKLPFANPY